MRPDVEEPDLKALISTLTAIADEPEAFTPSAISWTARFASQALQGATPVGPPATLCRGQTTMYDIPGVHQ